MRFDAMTFSSAIVAAALSLSGFGGWTATPDPGDHLAPPERVASRPLGADTVERRVGSVLPCDIPLGWRLGRIDGEFGLRRADARAAIEDAARLWEEALDRELFSHDPVSGFPVRFVYDERQAAARELERAEAAHRAAGRRLDGRRRELAERARALERDHEAYRERLQDLERRVTAHNRELGGWNRRGGAPPEVREELERARDSLRAEHRAVAETWRALQQSARTLRGDQEALNAAVEEHNRRSDELRSRYAPTWIESGSYREAADTDAGGVVSVEREIRVFRFRDPDDLRLVIAHELGHALGLGHTDASGAVMSARQVRRSGTGRPGPSVEVTPADLALFAGTCPNVGGPGFP